MLAVFCLIASVLFLQVSVDKNPLVHSSTGNYCFFLSNEIPIQNASVYTFRSRLYRTLSRAYVRYEGRVMAGLLLNRRMRDKKFNIVVYNHSYLTRVYCVKF